MPEKRALAREHARFWSVAEPFIRMGGRAESTMMVHPYLRSARTDAFIDG